VLHHRLAPKRHRFEYGIFMVLLDLDELDTLTEQLHLFGRNRRRPYNFRDDDHLQLRKTDDATRNEPAGLKREIRAWLAEQGVPTDPDCRIRLLTLPRVFGYVFNPVSFYFIETAAGEAVCAIAEVGNTFGELKPYLVPLSREPAGKDDPAAFRLVAPKHFYVSPFSDLELNFDFRLRTPGGQLQIGVNDVGTDGQPVLISTLTGERRPLTDGQLLRLTARYPLVTLHVIALIHWHAFKLWWKRLPLHRKAEKTELQRGVLRPHASLRAAPPISPLPIK
jgi:DUF1365 family protein